MSSIIDGYNYDIFISYRQKDNKHDGWVTEFVVNLKGELESTFKEDISVYFDINPHDGLLETHDVDESLKDKLKCLIFIPIISRTYCDPKSFAWEHEFKAFIKGASNDDLGLKIKLPNGNVASRVLPVQIHDLDNEDISLCESVLGGVLRGIEFIYKEAGVDKPLAPDDDEKKNLNKTKYRIQIVKVAHAIKEIVTALKQPGQHKKEETPQESTNQKAVNQVSETPKNRKRTIIAGSITAVILVILSILFIPKLFSNGAEPEKSIAVIPFVYLSDETDTDKQYLADGMMDAILLHLAKIQDLRVLPRTSVEQYRGTTKTVSQISKELGVTYILEGSFTKHEDDVKLIVQLIITKAGKEEHVWENEYDNKWAEIFSVQSEVAQTVAKELNAAITPEERQLIDKVPTPDLTAYNLTLQAQKIFYDYYMFIDRSDAALEKIKKSCKAALELDPGYAQAYYWLGRSSLSDQIAQGNALPFYLDTALYFFNKAIKLDSTLAEAYEGRGSYYSQKAEKQKAINDFNKSISLSPSNSPAYYDLGDTYYSSRDYVDALRNYNKAEELTKSDSIQVPIYVRRYYIYLSVGDFQKANLFIHKAEQSFPGLEPYELWLLQAQGKYEEMLPMTEEYITKYPENASGYDFKARALLGLDRIQEAEDCIRLRIKYSEPELNTAYWVGIILWKNGKRDEAMKYFNMQIDYCNESIISKNGYGQETARYDLAGVYAFLGNKEEAYKWLREYEKLGFIVGTHEYIKFDPLMDNLRNDDEFKEIVIRANDKAAEYRARINELEEEGKL